MLPDDEMAPRDLGRHLVAADPATVEARPVLGSGRAAHHSRIRPPRWPGEDRRTACPRRSARLVFLGSSMLPLRHQGDVVPVPQRWLAQRLATAAMSGVRGRRTGDRWCESMRARRCPTQEGHPALLVMVARALGFARTPLRSDRGLRRRARHPSWLRARTTLCSRRARSRSARTGPLSQARGWFPAESLEQPTGTRAGAFRPIGTAARSKRRDRCRDRWLPLPRHLLLQTWAVPSVGMP